MNSTSFLANSLHEIYLKYGIENIAANNAGANYTKSLEFIVYKRE